MMYLQEEGQVNVQGWFKMGGRITEEWGGSSPVTDREDEHWINQTLFISLQNREEVGDDFMSGSFRCKLKGFHSYFSSLGTNINRFSAPEQEQLKSPELGPGPDSTWPAKVMWSPARLQPLMKESWLSWLRACNDGWELVKLVESWFSLSSSLRNHQEFDHCGSKMEPEFINSTWNGILWLVSSQPRSPTA